MQSDLGSCDSPLPDSVQYLGCKVQAGRGRCYSSAFATVNRLVSLMVARAIWPVNVGGQWHVADLFHHPPEIRQGTKTDGPLTEASAGQDLGLEFLLLVEKQTFPNADLAPRPDQALPVVRLL